MNLEKHVECVGLAHPTHSVSGIVSRILSAVIQLIPLDMRGADQTALKIVEAFLWVFLSRRSQSEVVLPRYVEGPLISALEHMYLVLAFAETMSLDGAAKCYKYQSEKWFSRVVQDVNSYPIPRHSWLDQCILTGVTKRFVARMIARGDIALGASLMKGTKAIWLPLKDEEGALSKNEELLTRPTRETEKEALSYLTMEARRTLNVRIHEMDKFCPTLSSCNQLKKHEGGISALFRELDLSLPFEQPRKRRLEGDYYHAVHCDCPKAIVKPAIQSIHKVMMACQWHKDRLHDLALIRWRQSEYQRAVSICCDDVNDTLPTTSGPISRLYKVGRVSLPEPGKFRIITKGHGYFNTVMQPLQGALLRSWKRSEASTMLEDDLLPSLQRIEELCPEFEYWMSIDYESATDNVHRDASYAALKTIVDSLDEDDPIFNLFKESSRSGYFYSHKLKAQRSITEGQLMGHPLSFPLLCIMNLSAYRRAVINYYSENFRMIKEDPDRDDIEDCPSMSNMLRAVRINGDDAVCKGSIRFARHFYRCARDIGLIPSAGKNYLSKKFAMINSQFYEVRGPQIIRRGYLNLRLIHGINVKKDDFQSSADGFGLGKELMKMYGLTNWTFGAIPFALLRLTKKYFGSSRFQPSWILPPHLGGYGVTPELLDPENRTITEQQRKVAGWLTRCPSERVLRSRNTCQPKTKLSASNKFDKITNMIGPLEEYQSQNTGFSEREALINRLQLCGWLKYETVLNGERITGYLQREVVEMEISLNPKINYYVQGIRAMHPMSDDGIEEWRFIRKYNTCPFQTFQLQTLVGTPS